MNSIFQIKFLKILLRSLDHKSSSVRQRICSDGVVVCYDETRVVLWGEN